MVKKSAVTLLAVMFVGLISLSAYADSDDDYARRGMMGGYGMGPGMMGGYGMGSGMMGGYGMGSGMMGGYGMGSGMMGGYGMGPGMMGGQGMGPGMMGGYGMGPGMMGGQGMGPGMMSGAMPLWGLDLSEKQQKQISELMQAQQKNQFAQMQVMVREMAKVNKLFAQARPDAEAIGDAHDVMARLGREQLVSGIKLRNRIYDLLTETQRKQLYPAP